MSNRIGRSLLSRILGRKAGIQTPAQRRRSFLERLEDRSLMAVFVWDNTTGNNSWTDPLNWTADLGTPSTGADTAQFTGTAPGTVTVGAPITVGQIEFSAGGYNVSGSAITVGTSVLNSAGNNSIANNLIGGTGTVAVTGGTLSLAGANALGTATIGPGTLSITNGTAAGAVAVNSGGTFEINNVTHNAAVALNSGGTLRGVGAAARENGIVTVANAAVTIGTGTTATDVLTLGDAANDLTGGGETSIINVTGSGVVVQSQTSNLAAGTKWNIDGSTLSIGAELQLGVAPAAVDAAHITMLNNGTLHFTAGVGTGAAPTSANRGVTLGVGGGRVETTAGGTFWGGPFAGGTGLTKLGTSDFIIRSAGTQTIGAITINAGRLFFGNAGVSTLNATQLGASVITINNGGTLDAEHTGADYTIANAITINSGGNLAARRVGTTTFSGLITLPTTGTAIFNRDDAVTGAITFSNAANAVALTGDLTIQQGTINATVGQVNMNHVISGGFGLIKTGLGNLRLSGTSTYTGDTTILDGTIFVTGNIAPATNGNLGNSANPIIIGDTAGAQGAGIFTDGTLNISRGINVRAGSTGVKRIGIAGNFAATVSGPITLNDHVTFQVNQNTLTVSSLLADSGGARNVTKTSAGTLILSNTANTYTGVTSFTAGVLRAATIADYGVPSSLGADCGPGSCRRRRHRLRIPRWHAAIRRRGCSEHESPDPPAK